LAEGVKRRIKKQSKTITSRSGKPIPRKRRKKMSKGDIPRSVNKKKFDQEFERIFKKKQKQGGDSKVLNGDSRV